MTEIMEPTAKKPGPYEDLWAEILHGVRDSPENQGRVVVNNKLFIIFYLLKIKEILSLAVYPLKT